MSRSPLAPSPRVPEETAVRYRARGYWTAETLDAFFTDRTRRFTHDEAIVGAPAGDPKGHRRLTYGELADQVSRAAATLHTGGVESGDRVIVQLPNCAEYVVWVFAIVRIGAVPVFALPAHRASELHAFCAIADPAAWIVAGRAWGHDFLALADDVSARLRADRLEPPNLVDVETWTEPEDTRTLPALATADEVALLQLSGGTTGTPKLIPRTHADYLYSVRESVLICGVDADTRMLVALPASHNFPMSSPGILGVLHCGGTLVMAPDPSPRTCLGLVESEQVTMTSLVPPLLHAWLSTVRRGRHDLSSLERIQVGGARLADEVARRVRPELGARLQQVFGMAEGLVCYTRDDDPDAIVETTQGRPISPDDEILVVDEDDEPVPDGAEGRLLTRGPYTIRGYYRSDDDTSFTADGYYRTGDLVRRLPSGHLQVTGRAKDQINRGGEKIAVDEVEDHLIAHPRVHDAALIGIPDAVLGERSCAVVVPEDPALGAAELREFLTARGLATYKLPDRIDLVDAFPSTGVGKTSRRELRRLLADHIDRS